MDRRAGILLARFARGRTLLVEEPGGFPVRIVRDGAVTVCRPDDEARVGEVGEPRGDFATVIDATRPEQPADHERRLAALVGACRPVARVVLVACGTGDDPCDAIEVRAYRRTEQVLRGAGFVVARTIAFDLLAPLSPWRLGLGGRRARVLAELEGHLQHRSVRRAVILLERHLVVSLPPERAGRLVVIAERGGQRDPIVTSESDGALNHEAFAAAALPLLAEDAVVAFAAFLDAELLRLQNPPLRLSDWLRDAVRRPTAAAAAIQAAKKRGVWWYPDLEFQRMSKTISQRLTERTIATLACGCAEPAIAATCEYEVASVLNTLVDARDGGAP